ncbi:unnamed protein product [Coregonus sp. 'balchen']|uniref:Bcl-2 Bcl-2 homology region 1-3 domain-containing protein n=1 Tax=Coregonus suidteri TaxID=861788 RepID=A0AAN8KKS8_9TELE|nr:bcl-2-like protein 10 [Coregonus clupeaformis]CAB1339168.1 unnamed protein product [Coregonus sp. 'balchen']
MPFFVTFLVRRNRQYKEWREAGEGEIPLTTAIFLLPFVLGESSLIAGRTMSCGLWKETLAVAEDYLSVCSIVPASGSQKAPPPPPPSESAAAMRRLARDMEAQHQARFHTLAHSFLCQCGPDPCTCLRRVMEELVGDGQMNWGRVVSLFTFTGVLVRELQGEDTDQGNGMGLGGKESCRALAETIADYLGEEKSDWMLQNKGWEGFCKFFHTAREVKQDLSMKTALFAAAGMGIAGLTFLLVR